MYLFYVFDGLNIFFYFENTVSSRPTSNRFE